MNDSSPIKRALQAIERLEAELEAERLRPREPIAIVGMACRFPGGADTPAAYWQILRDAVDVVTEVPPERWNLSAVYDADPAATGKMNVRCGSFLPDVDRFDPAFFGISPREAVSLEPQQRLLLEVAWESLESAHLVPEDLFGSRTGVFVGIDGNDFDPLIDERAPRLRDELYSATGNAASVASGRLSYFFGFTGPSLSIDTACSSSLVAIHEACQSLRAGECERALAGGVNLILRPDLTITLCKAQMLSPSGRCHVFDASADGYIRGDGCGLLVLRRLSDALANAEPILAVIRGSMINQDGRSSGLTAPSGPSQQAVIRGALASAGVSPSEIGYVEAHGTGTPLGDPIEIGALNAVFRGRSNPLYVGSVKSNIGHVEAAAGVAGLIKVVLALQARQIPANLHFHHPNPFIDWEGSPLRVPTRLTPWPVDAPLAGVSGFGFSGTNAHVILGAPPPRQAPPPAAETLAQEGRPSLLLLSAQNETALRGLAGRYAERFPGSDPVRVADLCLSAATGRSRFPWRLATVVEDPGQLSVDLQAIASGGLPSGVRMERVPSAGEGGKLAFLFTGQGAQVARMGLDLADSEPVFRAALDRCDRILHPLLGAPLREVLSNERGGLDATEWTQPALFALEYALTELWASWGVRPDLLLGHSVGELVAACVAGVFSLEDGLRLVAARGRLMQALPAGGGMVAIQADETRVRTVLDHLPGPCPTLAIATINGPLNTVVAGRLDELEQLTTCLRNEGFAIKPLQVSHAFHSPLLDPMLDELEAIASGLCFEEPRVPLVSNRTGALIGRDMATATYWRRQAREPVRFADGIATLVAAGVTSFVEIGPGSTLLAMARGCVADDSAFAWLASLRRGVEGRRQCLESAASLCLRGHGVDVAALARAAGGRERVDLPFYPFQRKRHWPDSQAQTPPQHASIHQALDASPHDRSSSGLRLREMCSPAFASGVRVFAWTWRLSDCPYLGDHRVQGEIVMPAAGFLALLFSAARLVMDGTVRLEDLEMPRALVLRPGEDERTVQVLIDSGSTVAGQPHGAAAVRLVSLDPHDGSWQVHATGRLSVDPDPLQPERPDGGDQEWEEEISPDRFYAGLADLGYDFGPAFRGVRQLSRRGHAVIAQVELPAPLPPDGDWHPALLDACLQATAGIWLFGSEADLWLPAAIESCWLEPLPSDERLRVTARRLGGGEGSMAFELLIFRQDGRPIGQLRGLRMLRGDLGPLLGKGVWERWLWIRGWREQPLPPPASERLRDPSELLAAVGAPERRLRREPRERNYHEGFIALETLALSFVVTGLRELGLSIEPNQVIGPEAAVDLGVVPPQRRLFARLLSILGEAGLLTPFGDGWKVCPSGPVDGDQTPLHAIAALKKGHGEAIGGELALLERCGPALAAILTGRTPPLELLFPEGDLTLTTALYQHSPVFAALGSVLAELTLSLPRRPGAGDPLSILEIGAGTGSTTSPILEALPAGSARYTFTDVSPLFTRKAAEKFAAHSHVTYALLDIERSPREQGFQAQRHDLVIAANVLHATQSIDVSLAHVADLLAPGGTLLLLEVTSRQRWADLTFGLLDGWWRFNDCDLRSDYALLSTEQWRERLAAAGFDSIETIPVDHARSDVEGLGPVSCAHTIVVARLSLAHRPNAKGSAVGAMNPWLVVQRGGDPAPAAVMAALRARGDSALSVELVASPPSPEDHGPPEGSLRVCDSQDGFAALLSAYPHASGILHMASLGLGADPSDGTAIMAAAQLACGSLLHLLQALLVAPSRPPIWIVTRGGQTIDDEIPDLAASMVLGMARAVAEEHPDLRLPRVDLDVEAVDGILDVRGLLAELDAQGPREAEVALRPGKGGGRWITRLQRPLPACPAGMAEAAASRRSLELPPQQTTLISGAFGGLGPSLAHWAVSHGARRLLLLGHRPPGVAIEEVAAALRAQGVHVELAIVDVADLPALEGVLASQPPVGAVLHAVGTLDDGALVRQNWERFARVLEPKVRGACNLERATANHPVEQFILFSSATALLGNAGQANHAAANAFLDALARHRRQRSLPAISIQWGRWGRIGAGADARLDEHFAAKGFGTIDPRIGLEALTGVIERDLEVVAVLPVDLQRFLSRPLSEGVAAFVAEGRSMPRPAAPQASGEGAVAPDFSEQLTALPPLDRSAHLQSTVHGIVEDVLGLGRGELEDPGRGLSDLGLDSLLAIELRNRLQQRLGCRLPVTLAFDHPTPERIAAYLAQEVFATLVNPPPSAVDDLDGLSLDALADLLEERLAP
ncbi:MAG: beta-ketoacyl synthase N-terminal-like domain-containing protein [Cyanobacteriota bacterium]|nr:beta-ketoacyl synthase N-terminal-like domain-containing protein [Cyanobacteriota bacterium]